MNSEAKQDAKHNPLRTIVAVAVLLLQTGCSVFGIRSAEEASYVVLEQQGDFELREYASLVVVETTIDGEFKDAGGQAFKRLFGYISGENNGSQKIAMTAPVIASTEGDADGEKIDMTAPVIAEEQQGGWRYAFVLPAGYTLDSAPTPLNPDVRIREIKTRRVAALSYSGRWNQSAFGEHAKRLLDWLQLKQIEPASLPRSAAYDPPWTIPFLRRNEVLVDLGS